MNFFEELQWRGLIKDAIDIDTLKDRINEPLTCYCGFDPTADSLHIGHLQQIALLKRYQKAGHRVIALCGGATGMIGDPRPTTERKLLTADQIAHNAECIKQQLAHFIDFSDGQAILENNVNWLGQLNLIDFLRDYGKYFNVNYMINKDTIARRLETGISFTEFTYTILQAIDFLHLYKTYDCILQIGGSDQWGNLVSGCDLIRKICGENARVYGVTSPLITKSDGSKFGKSEGGNIWLDPNRTSAYEFYQFWINVSDDDVITLLKRLSFRSVEEIMELEQATKAHPEQRQAQKALASELTEMVHGQDGLTSALKISDAFFNNTFDKLSETELHQGIASMNTSTILDGTNLIDALVETKIAPSKREVRQWIKTNALKLNGNPVTDEAMVLDHEHSLYDNFIIRKGKKSYFVLTLSHE